MRVIDDDERQAPAPMAFGTAGKRLDTLHGVHRILETRIARKQRGERSEQVCGIEATDQLARERSRTPRRRNIERQTVAADPQVPSLYTQQAATLRTCAFDAREAVADHVSFLSPQTLREGGAERIIQIEIRPFQRGPFEQARFGRTVFPHRAVIVEMIA